MTTVSQIIVRANYDAGSVSAAGGDTKQTSSGSLTNDGYSSFAGSVLRNAAIGAATGAVIAMPTGIGIGLGAGIGAAVGAGSALIRHPKVASAVGDGMKGAMAGAAGGAVVGTVSPLGPVGGAAAGAIGGFVTGIANGVLKTVAGGKYAKYSIDNETSVWGRIKKGFTMGAVSGAAVGTGAGLLFGGIGALPGALWGAAIGGVGGAIYGATTGVTDAATGAKGVSFTGGGSGSIKLPDLNPFDNDKDDDGKVTQSNPRQSVKQCAA